MQAKHVLSRLDHGTHGSHGRMNEGQGVQVQAYQAEANLELDT